MGNHTKPVSAEQVAAYLKTHPDFFIKQPDVLDSLTLAASPKGTISLVQHRINRLQDKNAKLQQRLTSLLDSARHNSTLQSRMHQLCLHLIDTKSLDDLLSTVTSELKQKFVADEVALKLFYLKDTVPPPVQNTEANIALVAASDANVAAFSSLFTSNSNQPMCGKPDKAQSKALFGVKADTVKSFACLPIKGETYLGIIAIASCDPNHFYADMATDYLHFLTQVFTQLLKSFHEYDTPAAIR